MRVRTGILIVAYAATLSVGACAAPDDPVAQPVTARNGQTIRPSPDPSTPPPTIPVSPSASPASPSGPPAVPASRTPSPPKVPAIVVATYSDNGATVTLAVHDQLVVRLGSTYWDYASLGA